MSKIAKVLAEAGALDFAMVSELMRWGLPAGIPSGALQDATTPEEAADGIREVIESAGNVEIRNTDLDVLRRFMHARQEGRMYMKDPSTGQRGNFKVDFCLTKLGEYVFPWRGESIMDLMLGGNAYLKVDDKRIYFMDVRELFFGDHKAFMVCEPSGEEDDGAGDDGQASG